VSIVVDSSALLAVVLVEADAEEIHKKMIEADQLWISPINLWEVHVRAEVILGESGRQIVAKIIEEMGIEVELVGARDAMLAFEASKRFGVRPARLNLGDCFAYALAKSKDVPLLFKGNDFAATDVKIA